MARLVSSSWRVPLVLLGVFTIFWALLAVHPVSRSDWWLENILVFIAIPSLILTRERLHFSNPAYACLFAFFCLHAVGSHYTYSEVPYDAWFQSLTGQTLNNMLGFERNHYDRLVHFMYGALLVVPSVELFIAYAPPKNAWRIVMPVFFIMAHSVVYEMVEWAAASLVAPELGQAYLGTQGDVWDAQKDMGLATLGALCTMIFLRCLPWWRTLFRRKR
jgi:putative membrane protein